VHKGTDDLGQNKRTRQEQSLSRSYNPFPFFRSRRRGSCLSGADLGSPIYCPSIPDMDRGSFSALGRCRVCRRGGPSSRPASASAIDQLEPSNANAPRAISTKTPRTILEVCTISPATVVIRARRHEAGVRCLALLLATPVCILTDSTEVLINVQFTMTRLFVIHHPSSPASTVLQSLYPSRRQQVTTLYNLK